mgnify:CR=1 FL=1
MVVTRFPSLSQTFIALQIAELVNAGFRVDIYNLGEVGDDDWLPEGTQEVFATLNVYHFKNVTVSHEVMAKAVALSDASFYRRVKTRNRLKVLSDTKFNELIKLIYFFQPIKSANIIHYQCLDLGKKVARLKRYGFRMEGIKQLCSLRGSDITKNNNVRKVNWKQLDKFFDWVLPVCEVFKENVIAAGCKSNLQVISSPINTESLLQIKIQRKPNTVLELISVGRLVEKKGLRFAVSMCTKLKKQGVPFKYYIVGDGPLRQDLKNQVLEMGLNDDIFFLGALPSRDTLMQMAKADVLLAPSCRAGNGDSEGIPNVLKEAMLLGLQVVTTRHSGIPELIQHDKNGYLCDEKATDSLFEAISQVLSNKENWQAISNQAKQDVLARFTPSATTQPLIKIYKSYS